MYTSSSLLPTLFPSYSTFTVHTKPNSDISILSNLQALPDASIDNGTQNLISYTDSYLNSNSKLETHCTKENNFRSSNRCPQCGLSFKNLKGMRQHAGKVHTRSSAIFSCSVCSKEFKNKQAVKYHMKQVHERSTRVQCPICQTEIYNKYMLKKHVLKHSI